MRQEPPKGAPIATTNCGLRFDTSKAIWLGRLSVQLDPLHWFDESLYRTPRSQRYFLAGKGGMFSHYGRRPQDVALVSERILPLTRSEAKAWAAFAMPRDAFKREFG